MSQVDRLTVPSRSHARPPLRHRSCSDERRAVPPGPFREPRGLVGGNHVHVEMRLRDINTDGRIGHLSCSCACYSSLHAHVSIQDVGKDGGDHTALRPVDGPRRTRSDHRLPGGALPEAPPWAGPSQGPFLANRKQTSEGYRQVNETISSPTSQDVDQVRGVFRGTLTSGDRHLMRHTADAYVL